MHANKCHYLSMPFTIGPPSKINQDFRQITEQEYASIELARDRIYWLFSFHENYDIVLENYRELETSLFSVTLNFVVDRLFVDRRELDSHRRLLCRKLSNLLESITSLHCRLDRRTVEVFGRKSPERKSEKKILPVFGQLCPDDGIEKVLSTRGPTRPCTHSTEQMGEPWRCSTSPSS
jgi:hypothetical protein